MRKSLCLIVLLACLLPRCGWAQQKSYENYIDKYADMAVDQMKKYGIPASITLAQGLLESRAGQSSLATKGNNHFGIKVSGKWSGKFMLMDDDAPNEKFRVYKNAAESYEDHSQFLKTQPRYAFLFNYSTTDYKSWARGLKKAGYATDPKYADKLIGLIETYQLYDFDKDRKASRHHRHDKHSTASIPQATMETYEMKRCNGQFYVLAREGDTYASIAKAMKTKERKLRKYNEVTANHEPEAGEAVFLGSKRKKASKDLGSRFHTMEAGESLYSIAQTYGIRLTSLCKMNPIDEDYQFQVGDQIRIR